MLRTAPRRDRHRAGSERPSPRLHAHRQRRRPLRNRPDDRPDQVANGVLLDFEQGASHGIVVRVTDTLGASFDKAFTVGINDVNPETLFGGPGSDTLIGGPLGDFIGGNGGGDLVLGGGGNDSVVGGTGNDRFNGEGGDDFLFGSDFNPDGSFAGKLRRRHARRRRRQ